MHVMKRTSSWMFYFIINLQRQKLKIRKVKQNFSNADADVNADAAADVSKWSGEITVTTKIQLQEIEPEHYS